MATTLSRCTESLVLCCSLTVVIGCAEFTHLTTTRTSQQDTSAVYFIDAKQRAILTSVDRTKALGSGGGKPWKTWCAEPSPDALSALATSQGLAVKKDTIEVALNNALAESAASIGLRTQSIQLMRDAMYRLCEARISGYIDDLAFETMHRRFQSSMVAILAIEQLTSTVRAPTVVLSSESKSGSADRVAEYTEKAAAQKNRWDGLTTTRVAEETKLEALQDDENKAKAAAAENPQNEALKKTASDAESARTEQIGVVATAKKNESDAKLAYEAMEAARVAALSGGGTAKASGDFENLQRPVLGDAAAASVSTAVKEIVEQTLDLQFTRELCTTILLAAARDQLGPRDEFRGDSGWTIALNDLYIVAAEKHKAAADANEKLEAQKTERDEATAKDRQNLDTLVSASEDALRTAKEDEQKAVAALVRDGPLGRRAASTLEAMSVSYECVAYLKQSVRSFERSAASNFALNDARTKLLTEIGTMVSENRDAFANTASLKALAAIIKNSGDTAPPRHNNGPLMSLAPK